MEQNFDICVIGGGIQGAGIARAAALPAYHPSGRKERLGADTSSNPAS